MVRHYATQEYENLARDQGYSLIAGIDEVGRGALAGPVSIGVVVLPEDFSEPVVDSKLLSASQREEKAFFIRQAALVCEVVHVESGYIDAYGIVEALREAARRAWAVVDPVPDIILLDGRHNYIDLDIPVRTIVRGDQVSASIAAASLVAKVARDELMHEQALVYPEYGFETHVGYGVPRHLTALKRHGPIALHRESFITRLL